MRSHFALSRLILLRVLVAIVAMSAAVRVMSPSFAAGYDEKLLYSFCDRLNCTDGQTPLIGLLMDQTENLYGTTRLGGKFQQGVLFQLTPDADKGKWTRKVLYSFCARSNCADGKQANGVLIRDTAGNLYGTTVSGGKFNEGTFFKLEPGTKRHSFHVLHDFCESAECTDGMWPETGVAYAGQAAGLPWDGSSPLYGTTTLGGKFGNGLIYQLSLNGSRWRYKVLKDLRSATLPQDLFVDATGNLVATTSQGGRYGGGTIFRLEAGTWNQTVLYQFCAQANCLDGTNPVGRLVSDGAGNFFGVGYAGGTSNAGVVFEFTSRGKYKVLYNFCSLAGCADGGNPLAGLLLDADGHLFGTTSFGGASGLQVAGTAFKLTHRRGWRETTLYSFCSKVNCADGAAPRGAFVSDSLGNLFNTTSDGGRNGAFGTVLELRK